MIFATSTGTCSPGTTSSCSSGSRKRKTCTSTSLLDCSRSMAFGDPPKFDYARQVAAALAYIALADLDRVAVVAFAGDIVADFPLTRGKARILGSAQVPRGARAARDRDRSRPDGAKLRPSRPAPGSGGRHQRPVRPQRLRARARPAAPPPIRAASSSRSSTAARPSRTSRGTSSCSTSRPARSRKSRSPSGTCGSIARSSPTSSSRSVVIATPMGSAAPGRRPRSPSTSCSCA